MLLNLWMTLQFIVVLLSVDVDAVHPQSTSHVLVLVVLGAALLSPLASWTARTLVRVLSLVPHVSRARRERSAVPHFRLPAAPGTPGTIRPRAPSIVVHTFV